MSTNTSTLNLEAYRSFLAAKVCTAKPLGFEVTDDEINLALKPHQRIGVKWAVLMGRALLAEKFGLGKTIQQLEIVRLILSRVGGRGLIVCPLGVRQEFVRDAEKVLGWTALPKFIRQIEDADATGIYLTNYETVRDGKLDPRLFSVACLDEAAVLRGFGGTRTFREFMALFAGDRKTLNERTIGTRVQYRFVATATPSPNEYIELLAYAAFLDIGDVSQMKTRFFKRDSTKADKLTIHPHKVEEFWGWVSTWALFLQSPGDLGFDASEYVLPELEVCWHEVPSDHSHAGTDRDGQQRMFRNAAIGVSDSAGEKRDSLGARVVEAMKIVSAAQAANPLDQIVIWCDLDDEQSAIEKALKSSGVSCSSLYGKQDIDAREEMMLQWKRGETTVFLSKTSMYGAGANLQQAHIMIYAGIGFKFYAFLQGVHRIYRFLQQEKCWLHLIYTEAEREVRRALERKWAQHNEMVDKMSQIIKQYGLSESAVASVMTRAMGVQRVEVRGDGYRLVNHDCIPETASMADNSVDLILTSIPFSSQYEYSPNYADFGHSDNNAHFFQQMEFLIPELLRVLKPGRVAAIHVKDRIVPSGMTGLGFQVVYPFHKDVIDAFSSCPDCQLQNAKARFGKDKGVVCTHRFAIMGEKVIVTDVVRENNQTYRLGWSEQCKDGSKMGFGVSEKLLLFRKPPSDRSNGYADDPVVKSKPLVWDDDGSQVAFGHGLKKGQKEKRSIVTGTGYSRSRWQIDAHGFTRSSGRRLLTPQELEKLPHATIFKLFRDYSLTEVYDFEHHVRIGESMEAKGTLPTDFMLLQPQSWSPEVWTDITRMLTLNGAQSAAGREMHLCPMQLDLADRAIEQWTMPGELVFDPFAGLGTVPQRAVLKGRRGLGIELSHRYFLDACTYLKAAEMKMAMPDLFDTLDNEPPAEEAA